MARSKRGKKPLLQKPIPAASSQDNEKVENVQVEEEEVSAMKNLNDPKICSSSEDEDEQESETELATNPKIKPTVSEPNNQKTRSSDDDEGDDEEESDSESTPPKLKPETSDSKTRSSSDDEEDDEEETEPETPQKLIKPISAKPKKTLPKVSFATPLKPSAKDLKTNSSDDDDDEVDEEKDSDSEPASLQKLKPISSKSKKTVPIASFATLKLSTSAKKRHLESEKDSKKKKKMKKEVDDEGEKESERSTEKNSVPFQRVWSEADEVIILKSMIESEKKGVQPLSDLSGFLESIKESLSVKDAKPDQLKRKIRRLKVKYLKKAEAGEDHVLLNSHDQHLHGLSKEIWGVTTKTMAGISEMKLEGSNGIFHPSVQEWICSSNIKNMVVGESFLKQGLDLIGELKKKDLEQKLRALIVEELKLYLRRLELTRELIIAALDAWSSNASKQ